MQPTKGTIGLFEETALKSASIETTLYDLIGAVREVLPREEEKFGHPNGVPPPEPEP